MNSISSAVSCLPFSNSMPAYKSSVFSRTMTRSTGTRVEEGADALVLLAGADAGEQAQGLPQMDVDAAEAGADRRGDRGLESALGAADALHDRSRAAACRAAP